MRGSDEQTEAAEHEPPSSTPRTALRPPAVPESVFRHVLEAAPDGILLSDQNGRILLVNRQAEQLFGYEGDELLGQPLEVLLPERFRVAHLHHRAAYASAPRSRPMGTGLELYGLRKDGQEFPADISLSPLVVEDNLLVICIVRDCSERKRAETQRLQLLREQVARAEAEAALRGRDEFLASVTHDLKTPLTSIKGYAELLLRRCSTEPPDLGNVSPALERIDGAASRMLHLVNQLLDVARLQLGQPLALERRATDLVALARQVLEEQQQMTTRHRLHLEAEIPDLVGEWDASRLERVLGNLLSNAIKYSPEGGDIGVSLGREGPWAVLIVRDQGLGIPTAEQGRVFERFQRASNVIGKMPGTGIGLASARQIVERHGGNIRLESREGEGTAVTVRLPLTAT